MEGGEKVKKGKKSGTRKKSKSSRRSSDDGSGGGGDDDRDDKNGKAAKHGGGRSPGAKLLAAVLLLVVLAGLVASRRGGKDEVAVTAGVARAGAAKEGKAEKARKSKKEADGGGEADDDEETLKVGDVDFIESEFGNLGWTKNQGPLVVKRPPRECPVKRIAPQVTAPFFLVNKKDKWQRRIYTCLRLNKAKCSQRIMDDFEARRWKLKAAKRPLPNRILSTFVATDSLTLAKLEQSRRADFEDLYVRGEGKTYLNALLGARGLDGSIIEQFSARAAFTQKFGCSFNALKVQLPQFRYDVYSECAKMERSLGKHMSDSWALSAFDAAGVPQGDVAIKSSKALDTGSFCKEHAHLSSVRDSQKLASLVLQTPFKLQSKLFDVRSYLLIGSTMPMMVFFQPGYVRQADGSLLRSPFMFDEGATDINLDAFQEHLAKEKITGSHYVDTFLQQSMKQIARFVFHAARTGIRRRKGSFQLFSVDYVIDRTFRVYLSKTSGNPDLDAVRRFDLGPLVADMHDLVQELHEFPVAFEGMVVGDKYGKWELIFSELRETCHKIVYNPCHEFIDFNDKDLIKSNRKVGKVQATAKRLENEQKRIVKKTEERKKATCRDKKVPYPGTKCNKLLEAMEQEEFNKMFKEHEESFNPNEFRLPKPGEVFPHEIV